MILYNITHYSITQMFRYCPNCDNILDIGKNQPKNQNKSAILNTPTSVSDSEQESRDDIITEVVNKMINDDKVTLSHISTLDVDRKVLKQMFLSNDLYKTLDKKVKTTVTQKIEELLSARADADEKDNNSIAAYYICKKCHYSKKIENQTLILTRNSEATANDGYINMNKYKNACHNEILPLTRQYICTNKACKSHDDHELREAVIFRTSKTQTWLMCNACQNYWKAE